MVTKFKLLNIKLVIWDLDGTLWRGVLEEETVQKIPGIIQLVKDLTTSGIVNSICSKNDLQKALSKLEEYGLSDYFVFPHIEYSPKGQAVMEILERMKLRPQNTVFIDDNQSNRKEVIFYNDGIMALNPEKYYLLKELVNCAKDPSNKRLASYKLLEKKYQDQIKLDYDNASFLKQSKIKISINKVNSSYTDLDRLVELINRTNQLNYTKIRLPAGCAQLVNYFTNESKSSFVISSEDKYGNYGVIGFISIDFQNDLRHFLFSCRVLNMGIEVYAYQFIKSNFPNIRVPFDTKALEGTFVDWIELKKNPSLQKAKKTKNISKSSFSLLFPGLCNVEAMTPALSEYAIVTKSFPFPITLTYKLLNNKFSRILYQLYLSKPLLGQFIDIDFTNEINKILRLKQGNYNFLVHTMFVDAFAAEIRLPLIGNLLVPGFHFLADLIRHGEHRSQLEKQIKKEGYFFGFYLKKKPRYFFTNLIRLYKPISVTVLEKYICKLIQIIPTNTTLLIINLADHGKYVSHAPGYVNLKIHHRINEINKMLDGIGTQYPRKIKIVDLRMWIKASNVYDIDMHYDRKTYMSIVERISSLTKDRRNN